MADDEHPPFMYLVLGRPPRNDDDEPPILTVEDTLREARQWCRNLGGALIQKSRRTERMVECPDGSLSPEYEHVEYLTPKGKPVTLAEVGHG